MRRRVLAAVVVMTTLAVVAFFVPAALAIRSSERRGQLFELQRHAAIVSQRMTTDEAIAHELADDPRLGVYDLAGRLIGGSGPGTPDRIVREALEGNFAEGYIGDDLVAAVPIGATPDRPPLIIRIESSRTEVDGRFRRALLWLALAGLAVIGCAAAVATWLARRLNRPVEQLTAWAAADADVDDVPEPTGIGELDALRAALLDDRTRIEELLRRERSFSSQVSHQLRTPVAALRVAVETELESPRPDASTVLRESLQQLDRLESTITSLLALARHTTRTAVECDVRHLVDQRVAGWRSIAAAAGRTITTGGAPGRTWLDVDTVGHTLDVLVDNALKHGVGTIVVTAAVDGSGATIDVGDQGPRPHQRDLFAEDGSDSSHGIGLRLARALAESSHGRLVLLDRPTTTFRLTLPRAEPTRPS